MAKILRRRGVGFRLALVFGRNFLIGGLVARRGMRGGLGMKLLRRLIVRFVGTFIAMLVNVRVFFVSCFGDIEVRTLAVRRVRAFVARLRVA